MNAEEMKRRTKQFSIDVDHLILSLYPNDLNRNYSNQLYFWNLIRIKEPILLKFLKKGNSF